MNKADAVLISDDLLSKIDKSRGSLNREDFVGLCIETFLEREAGAPAEANFVTREDFEEFERNIKELERSFIEFLISYGLELWK